jgi:hypothetical protein
MEKVVLLAIITMACSFVSCEQNGLEENGQNTSGVEDATSRKVETGNVYDITAKTVTIIGSININISEYQDVAFGIMYSDSQEELSARKGIRNEAPYLNGKEFEVEIKGLKPQTMYYYCAWLFLNGKQYEYGDIKQIETLEGNIYAIGEFSVSNNKKVAFSSGNLQSQASTNTWQFAENQWDYIGGANSNISPSYSGWIDLFGWGTGDNPTLSNNDNNDYTTFVDWGKNEINNETPNTWRTLTTQEWEYLLENRPNSYSLYGTATINNVKGLIILPDGWYESLSFTSGINNWDNNVYSIAQWKEFEYAGAVFLPAAGSRHARTRIDEIQVSGEYWTPNLYSDRDYAYSIYFNKETVRKRKWDSKCAGHSVRLVKDL